MGDGNNQPGATKPRATDDRMTTLHDRGAAYRREENVLGGIEELRRGAELNTKQFHVIGFDINAAALTPGMKQDLDKIVEYIKLRDDVDYRIVVTGTASESRVQRVDPFGVGTARAEAIRDYFIRNGVPAGAILTFSHGSIGAPPATATPEVKAEWRGAFIDVRFSGSSKRPPPKPRTPSRAPDPNKDPSNVKILKPPLKYSEIPKKAKEIAEYFKKLNQSGSDRLLHDAFGKGWAHGLAVLTEAEPAARSLESFTRLPQVDLPTLQRARLQANANPVAAARELDTVRRTGMRLAFDQIRALGPEQYEQYAAGIRQRLPELHARETYYLQLALQDKWDL